jgi:diguanylate cyclase (GGDEF)-like protein
MSGMGAATPALAGAIWTELVTELGVGVLVQNGDGVVLAANPRAADLLGVPRGDLLSGCRPEGWQVCDDSGAPLPNWSDLAVQVLRAGVPATIPFAVTMRGVPHSRLWAEVHPVLHRGEPLLLTVVHPVQADIWRSKGLLDPLTTLPSRALLLDRLDQALRRARTHGTVATLVLMDVRGLAEINKAWGFENGDELLVLLAARLRDGLRADHTVARYSGGTFAVVADHPQGTGEAIAARVRQIAERRADIGHGLLHPSVRSCWVSSGGDHTVHQLICSAEARLRAP